MDNIYDMIWYDIISSFFPQTMAKFFFAPQPFGPSLPTFFMEAPTNCHLGAIGICTKDFQTPEDW